MLRTRHKRVVGSALALGTGLALAGVSLAARLPVSATGAGQGPGILEVKPESPVQGETVIAIISAPRAATVSVHFDGTTIPVFALADGLRRALIGTDPDIAPGGHTLTVTVHEGTGPPLRLSRAFRIQAGRFGVRTLTLPPHTYGLITPQNLAIERKALVPVLNRRSPVSLWTGVFQAPSATPMDSPYGEQSVYNGHRVWWHQGVDFPAPAGDPVVAANTGVVALAKALPLGGNTVVIDHGHGVLTEYLHLSAFAVRPGDRVERGAIIGKIGATGLVTGPSLHWGLYVNGIPVNPLFWLEPHPGLTS
jgi:murein DD-endopeptidase MepM/ murein hydrolase activator NlpD